MLLAVRLLRTCVIYLPQMTNTATEDAKVASAPKINEFRNKFEKFGAPTPKMARKPSIGGGPAVGGGGGTAAAASGSDAMEKASREAREMAEQLQQQVTQLENSRSSERQQLVDKLERRDAEMKSVNEKNAAVSQ